MRILRIDIDGFGSLRDLSLGDFPAGLVILIGDNEAGKTTCLSFIRDVLFGFRDGRYKENIYLQTDAGHQGGRLALVSDRFGEILLERRPGKRGGNLSVAFSDGRKSGEDGLREVLGATTRDLFKNVYAFSLEELQTIKFLDNEAVKSVLYGAAMGAATLALPTAMSSIEATMGELFKPGGKNPKINQKLGDLEKVKAELREKRKDIDLYDRLSRELLGVEKRMDEVHSALVRIRGEKEKAATTIRLWDDWIEMTELERALSDLPLQIDIFPEDGLMRLERLIEKTELDGQVMRGLRAEREENLRDMDGLAVNEEILHQSAVVQELLSRRETYLRACSSLLISQQNLESARADIDRLIGDLGNEWTEEKILAVDRSLFTREAILTHQETLEACARARRDSSTLVDLKKAECEEALKAEDDAWKAVDSYGDLENDVDEATILALRNGRDQFASVAMDLPQLSRQKQEELERLLSDIREINPDWGERNITEFNCSIGVRQKVQRIEGEMARVENDTARVAEAIGVSRKELDVTRERLEEKARGLAQLGPQAAVSKEETIRRKSLLRLLRTLAGQKERLETQVTYEEARLLDKRRERDEYAGQAGASSMPDLRPLSAILGLSGLVAIVIFSLFVRYDPAIVVGGVLVLGGAVLYWLGRRFSESANARTTGWEERLGQIDAQIMTIEDGLGKARESLNNLHRRIEETTGPLSLAAEVRPEDVDILEAAVDEEITRLDERAVLEGQVREWNIRVETSEKILGDLEERRNHLATESEKTAKEWIEYLGRSELPCDLTPRTCYLIFSKIENLRGEIGRQRDLDERLYKMERVRCDYEAVAARVPSLADGMGNHLENMLSRVDSFLASVREWEARRNDKDAAMKVLEERQNRRKAAEEEWKKASALLGEVSLREAEAKESWRAWLAGRGLSREMSPATAMEALSKIGDCVKSIREKERLETDILLLLQAIESYFAIAVSLCATLGGDAPRRDGLAALVDRLGEEYETAKTNLTRREELIKKGDGINRKTESAEARLLDDGKALQALFEAGCAETEDDFRLRGKLYGEKKRLASEIARAKGNLKKISGEENLDSLKKDLASLSLEELRTAEMDCTDRLQELDREREELHRLRADLKQQIASLASADDVSRLRAQEEVLVEEIRELAQDWGRHALAKALLLKARARFEEEQQPKVINDAARFFREITGGKYEKVVAPIGGETIEIMTPRGQAKRPEILSRGTAEQLFLAIRFGYITNHSANGESLPVIMDDVLVNFDPRRAEQTMRAILSLAEGRQILYFTCHPETVDLYRKLSASPSVFTLTERSA